MNDIYMIGGGGLAREIISWNRIASTTLLKIVGCFDDNINVWSNCNIEGVPLLGEINRSEEFDYFLMGIMDVNIKAKLYSRLKGLKKEFVTFKYEDVIVGERTCLGEGITMMPRVTISCDARIGNLVTINNGSQIGHDSTVGDFCSLMAHVNLGGGVVLEDRVFIGTGAIILPGVKIASGVRVGAGSVVMRSIKEVGTYFGNPAKRVF